MSGPGVIFSTSRPDCRASGLQSFQPFLRIGVVLVAAMTPCQSWELQVTPQIAQCVRVGGVPLRAVLLPPERRTHVPRSKAVGLSPRSLLQGSRVPRGVLLGGDAWHVGDRVARMCALERRLTSGQWRLEAGRCGSQGSIPVDK